MPNKLIEFIREEKTEKSFKSLNSFKFHDLDENDISTILEYCNITMPKLLYYYKYVKKYLIYNHNITYEIFWNSMLDLGYPLAKCRWGVFHKKLFKSFCHKKVKYMNVYDYIIAISILQKRCIIDFYTFIFKNIILKNINMNAICDAIKDLGNSNDYFPGSYISIKMLLDLFYYTGFTDTDFYDLVFAWNP